MLCDSGVKSGNDVCYSLGCSQSTDTSCIMPCIGDTQLHVPPLLCTWRQEVGLLYPLQRSSFQ